ncbi:MAG: BatD family protein [Bacteroidales bacterium]|nr:BatD family protein [Bacteroidales bacterium]
MRKLQISLAFLLCAMVSFAQNAIKVDVPNVVGVNEQFNLTFVIEGDSSPEGFEWNAGDDFQVVWGPQKGSSTSIRMINGKTTKSSQVTFTYILLPKKTGTFTISRASAKVDGNTIVSGTPSIEVVTDAPSSSQAPAPSSGGSSNQGGSADNSTAVTGKVADNDVFLRFSLSKTSAVIGEPVNATLKLYKRVSIVGLEKAKLPTFNGFWSQELQAPTNVEFHRESLDDKIYDAAVLRSWVLIPQQAGNLTIEPAELVCLVNVRVSHGSSNSIFDSFFQDDYQTVRKRVVSPGATVRVSALPPGAPASFGGGVGKYDISASLTRNALSTHEAASLVITVSGKGNVSLLEPPKVPFPPDFDVYDVKTTENPGPGGTSGSKTFEFPFIPRSAGDFTIESIPYSYYDVGGGKYVTVSTQPLRIQVAKGAETDAVPSSPGVLPPVRGKDVRNVGSDIRFISTKTPAFSSKGSFFLGSGGFWALLALIAAAAAAFFLAFRKMAARRADVAGTRNRKAVKMARRRLASAGDYLGKNLYTAFYEELHKALTGFISDKMSMEMSDMSTENIKSSLSEAGVDGTLVDRFSALLEACEFARYSPDAGHDAMQQHYDEALSVISAIDSSMKSRKKISGAALAAILLLLLPGVASRAASPADSLWAAGVQAYNDGRWADAVKAWEGISDASLESPSVYYNLGNAWFRQENYSKAILYYEKALKLDPSSKDARFNLDFASGFVQDRIEPVPEFILVTWARKVSWLLDSDAWAALFLLFLALAFALALLYLLSGSRGLRRTGFYGAIAALLLALASLGFSGWQKSSYKKADGAIVVTPVISVKSSPSEGSAKDLFILHEGTKVKILDEVGSWKNIELADGRQGWVLDTDLEII